MAGWTKVTAATAAEVCARYQPAKAAAAALRDGVTPRDFLDALTEADVCVVPQLRPGAVFDEEQARVNGMVCTVDDPQPEGGVAIAQGAQGLGKTPVLQAGRRLQQHELAESAARPAPGAAAKRARSAVEFIVALL